MNDNFDKFINNHVQIIGVGDPHDKQEKRDFSNFKKGMKKSIKNHFINK